MNNKVRAILKDIGAPVINDRVSKAALDSASVSLAAKISDPKYESKEIGEYAFSFHLEEDYSQNFLDLVKNKDDEEAFDVYDAMDWLPQTGSDGDVAWAAARNLFPDVEAVSINVDSGVLNLEAFGEKPWSKQAGAEALKKVQVEYRVRFYYELETSATTKLETAVAEAIKKSMEA